jgi:hypothetical protein
MQHLVYLSYDLGVKGDYESLYRWLDEHEAKECGDSVACFKYDAGDDVQQKISEDIKEHVDIDPKKHRVYLVWREGDKLRGKFLFGSRHSAPWVGAAGHEPEEDEE